jgi:hypothetical protein
MTFDSAYETISVQIAGMSRSQLKDRLLHFDGQLKLDFTESYLDTLDDERLRHILLAACLVDLQKQTPEKKLGAIKAQ